MIWLLVLGAASAAPPEVVAVVNGVPVLRTEFEEAAARAGPAGAYLTLDQKRDVLDDLVEEKLLHQEALRLGLDRDPKVVKVMVNTLLRSEVYATVKNSEFTEDDLLRYFDAHRDEFVVPEKVQIKRILLTAGELRSDAAARAAIEEIRRGLLADPDSFKDVAASVSEDPYKRRGGDVGFVSLEGKPGLDPAIVERAFALETGAISPAFRTDEGWNVITVAARRERVERTFEQMKGSVLRKVKNDRMRELYDAYVARMRRGAAIDVDITAIDAIQVEGTRSSLEGTEPEELDEP